MDLHRESETRRTKFRSIAKKARENHQEVFTSLAHYLTEEYLLTSYSKLRRSAATGTDKVSCKEYDEHLAQRIEKLHNELKNGTYKAPNIRRVWIEKEGGKQRPLGISTTEDKIVQRAVTDIQNLIYEQDFYEFSYGFRPNRNAHQALSKLRNQVMGGKIKWILDADIQGCFDNFDHKILRELLTRRVKDRSILRLIDLWLKTGVIDGKSLHHNTKGTPQGNIISPLLSNVYLHYVLDEWIWQEIRPLLKGKIFIIRYADDFVIGFEYEEDAKRLNRVLPKRMQKYGLSIHPEKSRLIEFVPKEKEKPPTFDFLGFTHYWAISQKGYNVVKRRTSKKKMRKVLENLRECCKENRHEKLINQYKLLRSKLLGVYQYYGIRGNYLALEKMYFDVKYNWYKWLNRRSQRKSYTWKGYGELLKYFNLPKPRIVHMNV
jgi:group II intron reverse transcriptase/maturase